jgi:hypothetical protein
LLIFRQEREWSRHTKSWVVRDLRQTTKSFSWPAISTLVLLEIMHREAITMHVWLCQFWPALEITSLFLWFFPIADHSLQLSYMVCQKFCNNLRYNFNNRTYVHKCCNYNYCNFRI